jgi:polyhydroxyalkanoate synthesis repressor PhaR
MSRRWCWPTRTSRSCDAKSGDDLTRSILLQIILEEESGGVPMFSTQALAQIIRFYGHAMQGMMAPYLEKNLQAFRRHAESARRRPGAVDAEHDEQLSRTKPVAVREPAVPGVPGGVAVPGFSWQSALNHCRPALAGRPM